MKPKEDSVDMVTLKTYELYVEEQRKDGTETSKRHKALNYDLVAIAGEVGELLGEHKKALRGSLLGADLRESILLEAGDTLHYLARILHDIDSDLLEAASANVEKLENRKKYGKGKHGTRS